MSVRIILPAPPPDPTVPAPDLASTFVTHGTCEGADIRDVEVGLMQGMNRAAHTAKLLYFLPYGRNSSTGFQWAFKVTISDMQTSRVSYDLSVTALDARRNAVGNPESRAINVDRSRTFVVTSGPPIISYPPNNYTLEDWEKDTFMVFGGTSNPVTAVTLGNRNAIFFYDDGSFWYAVFTDLRTPPPSSNATHDLVVTAGESTISRVTIP